MSDFQVFDRVIVIHKEFKNLHGIIKFIGNVEESQGIWCGIELDEKKGKNDGSNKGKRYFTCKEGFGIFCRSSNLRPESEGEIQESSSPVSIPESENSPSKAPDPPTVVEDKPPPKSKLLDRLKTVKEEKKEPPKKMPTAAPPKEEKTIKKPGVPIKTPISVTTDKKTVITKKITVPAGKVGVGVGVGAKKKEEEKKIEEEENNEEHHELETNEESQVYEPSEKSSDIKENVKESFPLVSFNQEEMAALKNEIENRNRVIENKDKKMNELAVTIAELTKRINELEKEKENNENENLQNIKIMQLEQKLKSQEQKSKYLEGDLVKTKKELEQANERLQQSEKSDILIENLTVENELLKASIEGMNMEISEGKEEIKKLKDELELIQLEMETAVESSNLGADTENIEQLKENNLKLRQALMILNNKYETAEEFHFEQIERYKLVFEKIPELERKAKDLEDKKVVILKKDEEIEELKLRLDEGSEYLTLIESLTNDMMKKEEEIIDIKRNMKTLKEERDLNNQLYEEADEYGRSLNTIIIEKENEINDLMAKINQQDETLLESTKIINKYREKTDQLLKEIDLYKDNAKIKGGEENESAKKLEILLERQNLAFSEKREIYKRLINNTIHLNTFSNEMIATNIFLKTLPNVFLNKLNLQAFGKYITMRVIRGKADFLKNEVLEHYLRNESQAISNIQFVEWMSKLCFLLAHTCYLIDSMEMKVILMKTPEEYIEFTKSSAFGTCFAIQAVIDNILKNYRDESLSNRFSLEPLKVLVQKQEDFLGPIIAIDEKEDQKVNKVLKLIQVALKSKFECEKTRIFLYNIKQICISRGNKQEKIDKFLVKIEDFADKIFKKNNSLLQIKKNNYYLPQISRENCDKILNNDTFIYEKEAEFSNIQIQIATFMEKTNENFTIDKDNYILSLKDFLDKTEVLITEYASAFPHVKRFSLSKEGEVVFDQSDEAQDEFQTNSHQLKVPGPWEITAKNLTQEIQQVLENLENYEKMSVELKEQIVQGIKKDEELKTLNILKDNLEKRVAELQNKSERVAILEQEKKRLQEKEVHLNDVIATLTKEFEGIEQKKNDLENELAEVRQKNAIEIQEINLAPRKTIMSKTRDSMLMNRLSVQMSNPNLISDFLKDNAGVGGGANDLEYIDIIQKLIEENLSIKNSGSLNKLEKMKENMPNFNKYMQQLKNAGEAKSEDSLASILGKMKSLKKDANTVLAKSKIIDLSNFSKKSQIEKNEEINLHLKEANKPVEAIRNEAYRISLKLLENYKPEITEANFESHLDFDLRKALNNNLIQTKVCRIEGSKKEEGLTSNFQKIVLKVSEFEKLKDRLMII